MHHDYADNAKDHDEQEHMTVTRTYYWDKVANAEVPLNATMNHYAVHGVIVDDPTDPVYAFAAGYTGAATLDKADGDLQYLTSWCGYPCRLYSFSSECDTKCACPTSGCQHRYS